MESMTYTESLSGVNAQSSEPVAAEQETTEVVESTESTEPIAEPEETGVDEGEQPESPAAEDEPIPEFDDKTQNAFAKRLAAERAKIEAEAQKSIRARDEEIARRFADQGIKSWDDLQKGWDTTQQIQQSQRLDQQFQQEVARVADQWEADPNALMQIVQSLVDKHPAVQKAGRLEQQTQELLTAQQRQDQVLRDVAAFKAEYPDLDPKTIPGEVLDRTNKGFSLLDSYRLHENSLLKEKIAKQEKALKAQTKNKENAVSSPGSVTGNGATVADYISKDTFDAKKSDQGWVMKNLTKIQESRAKW